MKITRKDATIETVGSDDDFPGQFRVILSAPTLDRDGDTLLPEEWKMPLPDHITFDIDHGMDVASTVGSGTPALDEQGRLIVDGTFSSLQKAQDTRTLVKEGHIRTTSVAFMTMPDTTKGAEKGSKVRELLNGAFVAIPSNREALVLSAKGIKAGARNKATDLDMIQEIHDLAIKLGASSTIPEADLVKRAHIMETKAVAGSLEATQDRARDALQDAYPGVWAYLRATLPDEGLLVFCIEDPDTYDTEEYQQSYTDNGSVITLTGERSAVDLIEVIKPDPDEDAEPASSAEPAPAKSPSAPSSTKAPDADSDAVNAELEAKALAIVAAALI